MSLGIASRGRIAAARRRTLLFHSYDAADSAVSVGTAETGQTPTVLGGGTWGISGNAAYNPSNTNDSRLVYLVGVSEQVVTAPITGGTTYSGVVARSDGATTHYMADADPVTGSMRLWKCIAGAYTNLATISAFFVSGDEVGLYAKGTTIRLLRNGGTVTTVTDSAITGGMYAGLRSGAAGTAAKWGSLTVRSP